MMRLWIDAMPLSSGGGVQVAVAFFDNLLSLEARGELDVAWQAVAPEGIRGMLPTGMSNDPRIRFLPKRTRSDLARTGMRLPGMARQFAPDVVFTVFGPAYFKAHVPHVVGFALPNMIYPRDGALRTAAGRFAPAQDFLKRQFVRRADHHVVETETVRSRLAERLGVASTRISVIPNSINPLLAHHRPSPLPRSGPFAILVPATYYPHKNLEILPEVARVLNEMIPGVDFGIRLTLDPASAPFRKIMQDARALGVDTRICTLGELQLDQLAEAYRQASAVMLPTLREASTAVYPESFHFERPLVTSDMDFARELCADAALFCGPVDASDYARALAHLITDRQEGAAAAELVAAGRRRLASAYLSPALKFEMQLALLRKTSRCIKQI